MSRLRSRIREIQRRLLRLCGGLSLRDSEYDFAYRHIVGEGLSVLDVGAVGSLLPLQLARRGFQVTVMDVRPYPERHANLTVAQGDFLTNTIPDGSFDYMVMISCIEHMGFGGYGDPICEDADFRAMAQAVRILKPDGKLILTFPFCDRYAIQPGFERWYDRSRVCRLFENWLILDQEYYIPQFRVMNRIVRWIPASIHQIVENDVLRKYGYQCNACYVLARRPQDGL